MLTYLLLLFWVLLVFRGQNLNYIHSQHLAQKQTNGRYIVYSYVKKNTSKTNSLKQQIFIILFLNIRSPRATYMSEFGSVSPGWNQGVRKSCSPPRAWVGLLNPLARWLTHITADKRPQFFSYWQKASVPYHMGLSKSHRLSSWHGDWLPPDQVVQERKQEKSHNIFSNLSQK